ncbi:hypothetical protein Celaphus_00004089 [Cervus elaphus hippelaphus]|uniref:CUB domain-containing protein n=1 Tax=Cervus elaphus hippelaphus TaxID=46360 RepID=A0A212DE58_CEREH|nr:hypothetical protein Celaphus_00004089 [Cervus elaphus hippelaphus]
MLKAGPEPCPAGSNLVAGDGDGAGLQPRRAVSAPLPPPQPPPPHRRLGPSRSAGPLGIMALEQLCSVLKGKRPGPRTAPPAGETGLFASLPGAGRPTRPFVWHERTADPRSRRDPLVPRALLLSPLRVPWRGTREAHRDSAALPALRALPSRLFLGIPYIALQSCRVREADNVVSIERVKVLLVTVLVVEGIAVAQKTQDGQNIGMKHVPATQCGIWVRTSNGGHFASPNYPDSYPPNKECIYILEAAPRQRIELTFDEHYYIEPSFECRFDHLEIRDGPFGFSPLIDRYCGVKSPPLIRSTGRFMWIKFSSDEELEGLGFRAKYSFIPDPDFTYLGGILNPIPDCQFELSGADGIVRSSQVEQEEKTKPGQAVDCIWTIKATPKAKVV